MKSLKIKTSSPEPETSFLTESSADNLKDLKPVGKFFLRTSALQPSYKRTQCPYTLRKYILCDVILTLTRSHHLDPLAFVSGPILKSYAIFLVSAGRKRGCYEDAILQQNLPIPDRVRENPKETPLRKSFLTYEIDLQGPRIWSGDPSGQAITLGAFKLCQTRSQNSGTEGLELCFWSFDRRFGTLILNNLQIWLEIAKDGLGIFFTPYNRPLAHQSFNDEQALPRRNPLITNLISKITRFFKKSLCLSTIKKEKSRMEPQIAGLASYILKFIVFLFLIAFLAGGFIYQAKDSINKRFKNENEKLLK